MTRSQVLPVIVETTRSPRELFRQILSSLTANLSGPLGLSGLVLERVQLLTNAEVVSSLFAPRIIERFRMFSIPATRDLIEDLEVSKEVVKVYPDRIVRALQLPTVPQEGVYQFQKKRETVYFTSTYYTSMFVIGVRRAHEKGWTGSRLTRPIAIIDTTALPYHESISRARPMTTITGMYTDLNGHGVWVAAAAAGREWASPNGLRTLGVAPNAPLVTIKALGFVVGAGSDSSIIAALAKAVEVNAKVINMSLGSEDPPQNPEDDPQVRLIDALTKNGVIVCVAAGNSGPDPGTINSPGIAESAVTVGAYDPVTGQPSAFSSRGPTPDGRVKPDVIAPGENVFGPTVGLLDYAVAPGRFLRGSILSGTSMATPHVAGLVALMVESAQANGIDINADTVKDVVRNYGEFATHKDNTYGWGVLTWERWERYASEVLGIKV
ncbi:MAG: S8 family serine peptidase [Nitrososphaerota archaeon]